MNNLRRLGATAAYIVLAIVYAGFLQTFGWGLLGQFSVGWPVPVVQGVQLLLYLPVIVLIALAFAPYSARAQTRSGPGAGPIARLWGGALPLWHAFLGAYLASVLLLALALAGVRLSLTVRPDLRWQAALLLACALVCFGIATVGVWRSARQRADARRTLPFAGAALGLTSVALCACLAAILGPG